MRLAFLGSGSSGNATAIECGGDIVLIDAGFSARETLRRLCVAGLDPAGIRALFVTHEHADHVGGVRVLAKRLTVPVYATAGTRQAARLDLHVDDVRTISAEETITVGTLRLRAFDVSHDAVEPVGYRVEGGCGTTLGFVSDTGVLPPGSTEALSGCDVLALECNHDEDMLAKGPYPWFLKQRILSSRGHLSNTAAVRFLESIAADRLRAVAALHLSHQNNESDLVRRMLAESIGRLCLDTEIHVVAQEGISTMTFGE